MAPKTRYAPTGEVSWKDDITCLQTSTTNEGARVVKNFRKRKEFVWGGWRFDLGWRSCFIVEKILSLSTRGLPRLAVNCAGICTEFQCVRGENAVSICCPWVASLDACAGDPVQALGRFLRDSSYNVLLLQKADCSAGHGDRDAHLSCQRKPQLFWGQRLSKP